MFKTILQIVFACMIVNLVVSASAEEKMTATVQKNGQTYTLKIDRWATGAIIVKDSNGRDKKMTARYPILAKNPVIAGDPSLCYQVCHDQCGNNVCWPVCWWKCTSQGGEGDPRRP